MKVLKEVIQEMLNLAKQIREAKEAGEELGLTADELKKLHS